MRSGSNPASGRKGATKISLFRSLRVRGALFAAILAGGAAYATGTWLAWSGERSEGMEVGSRAEGLAQALSDAVSPLLSGSQRGSLEAAFGRSLAAVPEMSALLVDAQGNEVCRGGPEAASFSAELADAAPFAGSLVKGRWQGRPLLEARRQVDTARGTAGVIRVRTPVTGAPFRAGIPLAAGVAAAAAGLLAAGYLSLALRPTAAVLKALDSVAREEYWHRVAITGSGELRAIAAATNDALTSLESAALRVQEVYVETAMALARTIEAKDRYTSGHSQRVARFATEIGQWLGFGPERLHTLELGALLHDVGKVGVPDAILTKAGPLTDEEFEEMKKHPMAGDRILGSIPGLRDVADMARSHHEKWAGGGYPFGVKGDAIPLEGRIIAIADAYDALVTKRSYKPALPVEEALARIEKSAGTHFDPDLASLFVKMKRNGKGYKAVGRRTEPEEASEAVPAAAAPQQRV